MSEDKSKIDGTSLSILLTSLRATQDAIRGYDNKAQIVSIGFIFSLGVITTVGSLAPTPPPFTLTTILISWILGVVPLGMFGYVLYPSRHMAPKLGVKIENLQRSYYVSESRYDNLDEYLEAFDKSDWKIELAYEVQKNALLRDMKRKRFVRALLMAGVSFSLLFLAQLLRAVGLVT